MKEVQKIKNRAREFLEAIEKAERIGIACHVHPDGDCLGAMTALRHFLRKTGKEVHMLAMRKDLPESYSFLPGFDEIAENADSQPDTFIALDCPNKRRLGAFKDLFERSETKINLDHHSDNEMFADINIVVEEVSSTSEIVFWLLKHCGFELDFETALPLYVGIVTDTGRFQYSNTFPSTFVAAKELVESGVKPVEVFRKVYENIRPEVLKLLGIVLERVRSKDGFYWSYLEKADFTSLDVSPSETENFIDYIRAIRGVKVAALLKSADESSRKWKVSLRSRGGVNVQKLCAVFGGGGHPEASGCELKGSMEEVVERIFEEYSKLTLQEERNGS